MVKQCRFTFAINNNFIDEVEVDVVPFDVYGVIFGGPYLYVKDILHIDEKPL